MDNIRWFNSLRWKIFFSFFLVSIVPLMIFTFSINDYIESYFVSNKEAEIKRKSVETTNNIAKNNFLYEKPNSERLEYLNVDLSDKSKEESFRILVINDKGIVISDTNSMLNGTVFLSSEVVYALEDKKAYSNVHKENQTMYTASPVLDINNGNSIGVVLVVSSISDVFVLVESISKTLMLLTSVIAVVIVVVAFSLSHIIIGPLNDILKVVNKMSEGHINQRVEIRGKDEFAQLGLAFNNMNDELEQTEKTRAEFVSNVSHELKTPLSSIKVLTESILFQDDVPIEMYREFLQDINSEIDRMTHIINDLLNLVKLDQRETGLNIEKTDLSKLGEDITKRLYPLAQQKGVNLIYEDIKPISIDGDEMKLSLAISNLVENGIKYTPEGGQVRLIIDADHQNAFITVEDTGLGISEEEQGKVFARFYRVDKTRDRDTGGTGLGLAITHSTVLLHNGSIRLTSREGEGSTFFVRIPIKHME